MPTFDQPSVSFTEANGWTEAKHHNRRFDQLVQFNTKLHRIRTQNGMLTPFFNSLRSLTPPE